MTNENLIDKGIEKLREIEKAKMILRRSFQICLR